MAVHSDEELYARVRRCLAAELALFAHGAGGRLVQLPGVLAAVAPAAPDRSLFNGVMAGGIDALVAVYDQLRADFAAAGVRAFSVWIDPGDAAAAAALAARGHVLDGSPVAMACGLDEIAAPPPGDLDWSESRDAAPIARINDAAYGFRSPAFDAVLVDLPPGWHAYVARIDGQPAGCLMAHESADGDCGICAVATLPIAQGHGIATRLMAAALDEAGRRGCVTTSLQASARGKPVYLRLGYRDLGAMQTWEWRTPR